MTLLAPTRDMKEAEREKQRMGKRRNMEGLRGEIREEREEREGLAPF